MSVLIKGLKMPKEGCKDCLLVKRGNVFDICPFLKREVNGNVERGGKPCDCPLIELPDHGDLIDREALKKSLIDEGETVGIDGFSIDGLSADDVCYAVENAPVVIPAEMGEEGFDGDTWHDLNGATAAPSGMKWQSNGKSRFSIEYAHRLVKKDTGAEKAAKMLTIKPTEDHNLNEVTRNGK